MYIKSANFGWACDLLSISLTAEAEPVAPPTCLIFSFSSLPLCRCTSTWHHAHILYINAQKHADTAAGTVLTRHRRLHLLSTLNHPQEASFSLHHVRHTNTGNLLNEATRVIFFNDFFLPEISILLLLNVTFILFLPLIKQLFDIALEEALKTFHS